MLTRKDPSRQEGIPPSGYNSRSWRSFLWILCGGVLTYLLLLYNSPEPLVEHRRPAHTAKEQVTVVMNTFKR